MLLSDHQNARQNHVIKTGNRCFENVEQFRYLGTTVTNQKTRVEAGSNTSTVNLRVVRGDEMGLKKGRAIA
jgi:hypothetical protein